MCLLYALFLRLTRGGTMYYLRPSGSRGRHFYIVTPAGSILHGTNKYGEWRIEACRREHFLRWVMDNAVTPVRLV